MLVGKSRLTGSRPHKWEDHVTYAAFTKTQRCQDAEKELNRSAEQARTHRRAASLAAVSSPHYASAGTDATRFVAGSSRRDVGRAYGRGRVCKLAPAPQEWIKPCNQLLGSQRCRPLGALPYLIHETTNLDRGPASASPSSTCSRTSGQEHPAHDHAPHQADGRRDEARIDAVRCPESAAQPSGAA